MPVNPFSDDEYKRVFFDEKVHKNALTNALDIRKYEIELYWKRATYFWTFIAATLAGFVAIQSSSSINKTDLSVLLCSLGIVFSCGWLCVNRGSKYWQENWENHVDMLEDKINGPLYKVVLTRADAVGLKEKIQHVFTGPSAFSVSKINQIISLYIFIVWCGLLIYSLPTFSLSSKINWYYTLLIGITMLVCISFFYSAKTFGGGLWHKGTIRTSSINNKS
ncbi:hypothetical protein [Pantoea eucrina]|uniref:RipA family octameric membrane protein n=1 Tax=Pantoea eucrina TaxID=472693 RepID=UPI003CEC2F6C